ncbi:hypothetical protein BGZ82_004634 [Podila clonocystis]|nr:hypothetical protein BGZ82_004634 [Podila clonocystis]
MSHLEEPYTPSLKTDDKAIPLKLRRNASSPSLTLPISEPEKIDPVQDNNHYSLIVAPAIILSVFIVDTSASYNYYTTSQEFRNDWWLVFGNIVTAVLTISSVYIIHGLDTAHFYRILCYWTVAMITWVPVEVVIWAGIDKATGKSAWFEFENGYRGESVKHCERVVGPEEVSCRQAVVDSKLVLSLMNVAIAFSQLSADNIKL